jgi:hypothetical protein
MAAGRRAARLAPRPTLSSEGATSIAHWRADAGLPDRWSARAGGRPRSLHRSAPERHPPSPRSWSSCRACCRRAARCLHASAGLEDTPLCLHAAYGAREVLTAVGWLTATRARRSRLACCRCQPQDRAAVRHARQERGLPRPHRLPRLRDQRRALSLADAEQRRPGHARRAALPGERHERLAVPAFRACRARARPTAPAAAWRWSRPKATGR